MATMRAMQVSSPGGDFELVEREIPEPKEEEVLIKVEACGICHGNALVKEGNPRYNIEYPRVPGHEVVGIIDQLGSNVMDWQIGQRVGVGWYGGPCHQCYFCQKGEYQNCVNFLTTGISFDGGYADYMIAPKQAIALIPEELNSLDAAPLLCAGRTTYTALRNSGARAGDLVAIQGLGGLGHLAVQFARKMGFKTAVLSRGTDKEELAYQLGAHIYIDAEATNAGEELKKLGGAKVILATAPSCQAMSEGINGLGYDGTLLIVAFANEPIMVNPGLLIGGRRTIRGWTARPGRDPGEDALRFSVLTNIVPMIEVFPLEEAATAYEKMMTSKVHFRSVLKMGD